MHHRVQDQTGRLGLATEQFWMNASRQDLHVQAVTLAVSLGGQVLPTLLSRARSLNCSRDMLG